MKEKRYFFGRKLGENKCKIMVAAGSGYWKSIGKARPIINSFNHIVGLKKTLIFRQWNNSDASKIQWVMQEFRHFGSANFKVSKPKLDVWVVYRLFQRRRRPKRVEKINSKLLKTSMRIHSNFVNCRVEECCIKILFKWNYRGQF